MKKSRLILTLVLTIFLSESGWSQNIPGIAKNLEGLFRRVRENRTSAERLEINDSIMSVIDSYCMSDSVFNQRFTNLRFLGQITSPDSLVRIITWNLILPDGGSRYFCYFVRKPDETGKNIINKLTAVYNESVIRSDTTYSESDWYGALYYDIRPFISGGKRYYLLLGLDYGNSFITRKVIDVLTFGPDGHLIFGRKCFTDGKQVLWRVVFEYSSTAVMSLRFESDQSVVFDHLSPFTPNLRGNRQFYGPDFSFDSYNLENGMWKLKEDIDIRNKEVKK